MHGSLLVMQASEQIMVQSPVERTQANLNYSFKSVQKLTLTENSNNHPRRVVVQNK